MRRAFVMFAVYALALAGHAAEKVENRLQIGYESELFASREGSAVTHHDLDAYMQRIPEKDRAGVLSDPERIGRILDELMLQRRIFDDAPVDELLADPLLSAQIYQAALVLIGETRLRKIMEQAELDSYRERGRELYLANPDRFREPMTADFTHVIVSTSDRSDFEAVERIGQAQAALEEGMSFEEVVMEYSDDPSKTGNRGSFSGQSKASLDERFADVLFDLEPGEISAPVRTRYGWHIIRLDALHEGRVPEYEQVSDRVAAAARRQHLDRVRGEYMEKMARGDLEIEEGAVEKLLNRYPAPEALR